jgi:hypothetical protein
MRYAKMAALDPDWLAHHFVWVRDSDGVDQLIERKDFLPIPNHGELTVEEGTSVYRLEPVGFEMRVALSEFLVAQFNAESVPAGPTDYEHTVRIDGQNLKLACSPDSGYLIVCVPTGQPDSKHVAAIATRFDAELATGKHDTLFNFGSRSYHH